MNFKCKKFFFFILIINFNFFLNSIIFLNLLNDPKYKFYAIFSKGYIECPEGAVIDLYENGKKLRNEFCIPICVVATAETFNQETEKNLIFCPRKINKELFAVKYFSRYFYPDPKKFKRNNEFQIFCLTRHSNGELIFIEDYIKYIKGSIIIFQNRIDALIDSLKLNNNLKDKEELEKLLIDNEDDKKILHSLEEYVFNLRLD